MVEEQRLVFGGFVFGSLFAIVCIELALLILPTRRVFVVILAFSVFSLLVAGGFLVQRTRPRIPPHGRRE